MRLTIEHHTVYRYDEPVAYSLQQLRLRPKDRSSQQVEAWDLTVEGGTLQLESIDQHGNIVDLVSVAAGTKEIAITCRGIVETSCNDGIVGQHASAAPLWYFQRSTKLTDPTTELAEWLAGFDRRDDAIATLHALSDYIRQAVAYRPGATDSETTAADALARGEGVCQDHAHIFITAARELGFPARYVSGYLMMDDRVDQDASHGWAEAHVDGVGWVGFDVANGYSPDERYVRVATGLDYGEASPVRGMRYGEGDEELIVSVQVQQ